MRHIRLICLVVHVVALADSAKDLSFAEHHQMCKIVVTVVEFRDAEHYLSDDVFFCERVALGGFVGGIRVGWWAVDATRKDKRQV